MGVGLRGWCSVAVTLIFLRVITHRTARDSFLFLMKLFYRAFHKKGKKWFNGLLSQSAASQESSTSRRIEMGNTCALMALTLFIISLFCISCVIAGSGEAFILH